MDTEKKSLLALMLFLLFILSGCSPGNDRYRVLNDMRIVKPQKPKPVANLDLGDTQLRLQDGMPMVYVPAGTFEMGSNQQELCISAGPAHEISLDAFWIDQTEVTNTMFANFLNEQGNQTENGISWLEPGAGHRGVIYGYLEESDGLFEPQSGYEHHPVIEVSWYGAAAYCDWVGGRLPTEAEWEFAARGPEGNHYPWGNLFDGELVNYCDHDCPENWRDKTFTDGARRWTLVGSYPAGGSWCGALDMAGNVWEWVNDWWSEDYYANSPSENPEGPDRGYLRIARGGSWFDEGWRMNSICRKGLQSSSARMHWVGFRCVVPSE
jgi:serine/threonine-protein kinase